MPAPTTEPQRSAYRAGAAEEARLRAAPRERQSKQTRELLDYIDGTVKYYDPMTPGELLAHATFVFESALTKADRRAIRRALRGKR